MQIREIISQFDLTLYTTALTPRSALQADLGWRVRVYAVATQAREGLWGADAPDIEGEEIEQWVTRYKIRYSPVATDDENWFFYTEDEVEKVSMIELS